MTLKHTKEKDAVIARLGDMLKKRLGKDEAGRVVRFSEQYYARTAPIDLLNYGIDDLYGALLSHWHFAGHRTPGKPLVRIFNPVFEEHGWQSTHTVIEVIADDMPFLLDSLSMGLIHQGINIHFTLHPVIPVHRDDAGNLVDVFSTSHEGKDVINEAFLHFEVDRQADPQTFATLHKNILHVLMDVRLVVDDWKPMRAKMKAIIDQLSAQSLPLAREEKEESINFLRWVEKTILLLSVFAPMTLLKKRGRMCCV